MKVGYGINVYDEDNMYVRIAKDALEGPVEGLVPGKFLVEFLPFLRYIPPWFPFATSQRLWAKWQAAGETLKNTPFEETKEKLVCTVTRWWLAAEESESLNYRPVERLCKHLRRSCYRSLARMVSPLKKKRKL